MIENPQISGKPQQSELCGDCGASLLPLGGNGFEQSLHCLECGRVYQPGKDGSRLLPIPNSVQLQDQHHLKNNDSCWEKALESNDSIFGKSIPQKWKEFVKINNQTQQNFSNALLVALNVATQLHLSKTSLVSASEIILEAFEKRLTIGASIAAVACASIYLAERKQGIALSTEQIGRCSNVGTKDLRNCVKRLERSLHLSLPPPSAELHLSRLLQELGLQMPRSILELCSHFLTEVETKKLSNGRNPAIVAGSILYLASKLNRGKLTQKEIAGACYVTETSLRSCIRSLERNLACNSSSS